MKLSYALLTVVSAVVLIKAPWWVDIIAIIFMLLYMDEHKEM